MKVFTLILRMKEDDLVLESEQVVQATPELLASGLNKNILGAALDAVFDITDKHIKAKRAREERKPGISGE